MEITCKQCSTRLSVTSQGSPFVKCATCGYPNPVKLPPGAARNNQMPPSPGSGNSGINSDSTPPPKAKPSINEAGWLIVHDENAPVQTYPLRIGKQIIGRKNSGLPCDIMIVTQDPYMSRNHCLLEVRPARSGGYDYLVSDVKMSNGKPENMSSNGTFVNAFSKPLQPSDMVYLNDGDTIQLGQTKVVIKTIRTVSNADDATRLVKDSDYMPTVFI